MEVSSGGVERQESGEEAYSQAELEVMIKDAYSVENRAAHGKGEETLTLAGTLQRGNRLYDVYRQKDGTCWYGVRVVTPHGIVSEYEAVFGRPEKEKKRKRRKRRVKE